MASAAGFTREERAGIESFMALATATEAGGALVLVTPAAPGSPMLNRVVGLGVGRPATDADIDAALAAIEPGVTFYVAVAPDAQPATLPERLRARGLEPGWGWMSFRRDTRPLAARATSLRLVDVQSADEAAAFGRIVCESYGLAEPLQPVVASAPDRGWLCLLACDGDEPVGAAALYVADMVGYLGFAGTLAQHRGKGAQGALLAERIRRAADLGCDVLVTETGERSGDRPSNSYRNILRAGFTEHAVTANWLGRT